MSSQQGLASSTVRALRRSPTAAAVELLGCLVVSESLEGRVAIRLTEVEAYAGLGQDPGSHAHRGQTLRNASMWKRAGTAYVYFTYGMHWCLNVVTGVEGEASAVLLRAGEVTEGTELARQRRAGARDRDLARGPARLAQALGVTGALDGVDLLAPGSSLRLERRSRGAKPGVISSGPRVGVSGAGAATPWRFWLSDEATVSPYRAAAKRG